MWGEIDKQAEREREIRDAGRNRQTNRERERDEHEMWGEIDRQTERVREKEREKGELEM
jgi:RNA-binding protein 39